MNKKFTRNGDDDEDDEFSSPKKVQYYKREIPSFEMIVNLNDSIRDPGHYFDLVEEMESLTENDIVDLKVNSPGGRLDGLVYLVNAIRDCEAPVIGTLSGEAASAATVILLSCDGLRIKPYSTMMIHTASFGGYNHQSNMVSQTVFVDKQARKILTDAYQDFVSQSRYERRDEIRKQRFQEEIEALEKAENEPKKPSRKKKEPSQA